jgi:uncharacterized protein YkwD
MRNTLTLLLIFALTLGAPLAQGEGPADETRLTLRQELLRLINRDRAAHHLGPVELDADASATADRYCGRQIRTGTTGHFSTDGESPYMRYSWAGGNDGVSENAAAWSANYRFNDRALYEMIRRSEEAMMAEEPPHDGHRRTILDPYATHVGIGLAWEKGEFRIAEEFVRRYVSWTDPLPRNAMVGEKITGNAKTMRGYLVEAISVHHERAPESISPITANLIDSYSLPQQRRDYLPRLKSRFEHRPNGAIYEIREEYSDGRRGDFPLSADGTFSFTVPFADGPGIYTVVVWVRRPGETTPIAASNISIRVTGATPRGYVTASAIGTR